MKKRIISMFMTFIMVISVIAIPESGFVLEAKASGLTLTELQAKFPHGRYWNRQTAGGANNPNGTTTSPCSHGTGNTNTSK
ncbi:MAG: hypothetical protein LBD23_16415, partial [Oscillospiraceae bacterium]|nr:hypothetical protein [Oscillospiraceae bacterium]